MTHLQPLARPQNPAYFPRVFELLEKHTISELTVQEHRASYLKLLELGLFPEMWDTTNVK
jgi:hypothetical protein